MWIVVVVVILLGGWYWYSSMQGQPAAPSEAAGSGTQIPPTDGSYYTPDNLLLGTDGTTTLGTYLVGSNGMTLYTYAKDTKGVSNCAGTCAQNWPPYLIASTDALANLEYDVTGTAGTITRADGTMQVIYDGMPLYFYAKDIQSGDTNGQNVGGVWSVVKP